jgi:glycosyltransferase involved in cell wall biosynthesis
LLERISASHELGFLGFVGEGQAPSELIYPGKAISMPQLRIRGRGVASAVEFYKERLTTLMPAFATYVRNPQMSAAIREQLHTFSPNIVMVTTTEMGQYLNDVPRAFPRVLDLQDVSSRWMARAASAARRGRDRALLSLEAWKTRRYEARCAQLADVVLATSSIESAFLHEISGIEAIEVPNGVDTQVFRPARFANEGLVFVGPLTSQANMEALIWFCDSALPLLVKRHPEIRVKVAGQPAGERWPPEIQLLGRVEDVRSVMSESAVNIVPIRTGSGTRYKILEALSMQQAVVSTSVGAEGLGVVDGVHLRIADDPETFTSAITELLESPEKRSELGRAGRAHVVERFDWDRILEQLEAAWDLAMRRARSS